MNKLYILFISYLISMPALQSQDFMEPVNLSILDRTDSGGQVGSILKFCGGYDYDIVMVFEGEFPEKSVAYGLKFGPNDAGQVGFY